MIEKVQEMLKGYKLELDGYENAIGIKYTDGNGNSGLINIEYIDGTFVLFTDKAHNEFEGQSNYKEVKSVKAVKTYINRFINLQGLEISVKDDDDDENEDQDNGYTLSAIEKFNILVKNLQKSNIGLVGVKGRIRIQESVERSLNKFNLKYSKILKPSYTNYSVITNPLNDTFTSLMIEYNEFERVTKITTF